MHQLGFEPTIPAFERAKAVHAATMIGSNVKLEYKYIYDASLSRCWHCDLKKS
jgi:hypothetical protein